jgi:hypothetical protein
MRRHGRFRNEDDLMRAITIINTRALPDSGGPAADAHLNRMGHLLKTPDKHIFP